MDREVIMYVSDWMTKKVFTVNPDDSISDAIGLMKEEAIKHLPVQKNEKLIGIFSDRDIKEYCPSKATALDIYELNYLLAKTKVKEMMKSKVITTVPDTPVEEAAMTMLDHGIGCLPVVEHGKLVGIISDRDIYRALVDITGVRHGGHRVYATIEDRPGSIKDVADIIRKHGFHLQSILTSYEGVREGYRKVVIRTKGKGNFNGLKDEVENTYKNVQIRKG
jgi:acetoin utilization protein AcuB